MLRTWLARIRGMFLRRKLEGEFSEEIQAHLEMLAEEHMRRGMTPDEARLAARRSFGGVEQIREEHREGRGLMPLDRLAADLSYAFRMMRRSPGFTLVAVLTLALGIGVNASLFSAYNALALKPLPVADAGGVYRLERWFERNRGNVQYAFSYPEFAYVRDHAHVFDSLVAASWPVGAFAEWPGIGTSDKVQVQLVSANYFTAMGILPRFGPGFAPDADRAPGVSPMVVLSHYYWQSRLNGDPGIVGRIVKLNGTAFTVVGVAPEEFTGTSQSTSPPDCWAPVTMQPRLAPPADWLHSSERALLQILVRVKPGITARTAQSEAAVLIRQFGAVLFHEKTLDVTLQHVAFFDNTEDPRFLASVLGIMLVVGLVLAVACANLANMMLARGAARQREIGVRLALGAGRSRVVRQLLTESVVLALTGGLAGLVLSYWTSRSLWLWVMGILAGHFPDGSHMTVDLSPDLRVLGYTLAVSLASGLLFGLSPALRFTRPDLLSVLKDQGPSLGDRLRRSRLRSVLVAGQVAVSMMLLVTSGLLTRGLLRSRAAEPGFETRTLYRVMADFGTNTSKAVARQRSLLERLRTLPVVSGVAQGSAPLLGTWTPPIVVDGVYGRTLGSYAAGSYMETLGIPLLRGRAFTPQEIEQNAPLALISEATARKFWPSGDAIGRRFQLDMNFLGEMKEFSVIGVVKDVRFANLTRLDPAHVYLTPKPGDFPDTLLRIHGDRRAALTVIRSAIQATDPDLMPSLFLMNMDDGPVWLQKIQVRAMALATLTLAGLTLLLAGVGIYGVMSFLVTQRTREIGIRMAMGAAPGEVVRRVVMDGLRPVFVGIVMGFAAGAGLSAALHSTLRFPGSMDFLYGVSFYDPLTFLGLSGFLLGVAALASAAPARRASRVDPMVSLRYE